MSLANMDIEFIRRELDAINRKWREIENLSDRKGEALAIDYQIHIHPELWEGIVEYFRTDLVEEARNRSPLVFPELKFLQLTVRCDASVEGWLILPNPRLPMVLRS